MATTPIYEGDRLQRGANIHTMITETGLDSYLRSESDRHALIDSLTPEAFTDLVVRVHEAVTGRPDEDDILTPALGGIEADDLHARRFLLSAPEDKQELLNIVLESAQTAGTPDVKALTIGYGINIVHPFADGNGRTARALYYMLSRDFEPENIDVWRVLADSDGDQLLPLNASIFTPIIEDRMMLASDAYQVDTNGDPQPKVLTCVSDPVIANNPGVFLEELSRSPLRRTFDQQREVNVLGILDDNLLQTVVPHALVHDKNSRAARDATITIQGGQKVFVIDRFLRNATDKDIDNIHDIHRQTKFAFAKQLIRSVAWIENKTMPVATPTVEYGIWTRLLPEVAYAYTERRITFDMDYFRTAG